MANIIQIKHGTNAPSVGALQAFELGYCTDDGLLYIGQGENQEAKVVGSRLVNEINSTDETSGVTGKAVASYVTSQIENEDESIKNYLAQTYLPLTGGNITTNLTIKGEKILTTDELVKITEGGTSASTPKQARLNLAVSSYGEADYVVIATAENPKDFNTEEFRELGKYGIAINNYANYIANIPEALAGVLEVSNTVGKDESSGTYIYLRQVYKPYSKNYYYSRFIYTGEDASSWVYKDWEKSNENNIYLPLAGGIITGKVLASATGSSIGYYLKDSTGYDYPGINDDGENLWIGSTEAAAKHHTGKTYISTGHDGTAGNETIYICIPNAANNGGSLERIWHEGLVSFKTS